VPRLPHQRVFVDTSAWVALAVSNDEHHQDAVAILNTLKAQRTWLYTTNFVVAETHAFILRVIGPEAGRAYLRSMDRKGANVIVRAEPADEENARAIIYRYTDKEYSLVDAISFVIMERLGISHAFAFDRHFAQYGMNVLEP
jgi:predicted nucleic acid-binding protein